MTQSIRVSKNLFNDHSLDADLVQTIDSSLHELESLFENLYFDVQSNSIVVRDKPKRIRHRGLNKKEQLQFAKSYLESGQHIVALVETEKVLGIVAWQMLPTAKNIDFVRRVEGANCQILNQQV